MDFKKINLKEIKYNYNGMKYNGEKIIVESPIMICHNAVEKYFNKYEIKLEFPLDKKDGKDFLEFMKMLEINNRANMNHLAEYRSQLYQIGEKWILVLKVPYRYNNFEVEVKSKSKFSPTIFDIKEGDFLKSVIDIEKMWHFSKNSKLLAGCLMEIKEVELIN